LNRLEPCLRQVSSRQIDGLIRGQARFGARRRLFANPNLNMLSPLSGSLLKPEEASILGLLLFLFGVWWIAFAAIQPIPTYSICSNGSSLPGIPSCGFPGPQAVLFYALGTLSLIGGSVLLFLRVAWNFEALSVPTSVQSAPAKEMVISGGSTPKSFVKKCSQCGREVPLAAESCYSCGAKV
jgi:hypothetical protein